MTDAEGYAATLWIVLGAVQVAGIALGLQRYGAGQVGSFVIGMGFVLYWGCVAGLMKQWLEPQVKRVMVE